MGLRSCLVALCLLAAACAGPPSTIVRVVDGHEIEGDYIPPEAYALYLQGAYHESRDEAELALRAYDGALSFDPESVELHTRKGAVACRYRGATAKAAFHDALARGPAYPPLLREIAECHLTRGELEAALEQAMRAVRSAPRDEESTRVLASVLTRLGRREDAARWTRAFERFFPALAHAPSPDGLVRTSRTAADEELSRALSDGDLSRARVAATTARRTASDVALRAASMGLGELALEQALLVLEADGNNADAWAAAVAGAQLAKRHDMLATILKRVPHGADELGVEAIGVLASTIDRWCGADARRAFVSAAMDGNTQ